MIKKIFKITNKINGKVYIMESKNECIEVKKITNQKFKQDFSAQDSSDYSIEVLREYDAEVRYETILNEKKFYVFIEWIKETPIYNNMDAGVFETYIERFFLDFAYGDGLICDYAKALFISEKVYLNKLKEIMGDNFYKVIVRKNIKIGRKKLIRKYDISADELEKWIRKGFHITEKESEDPELVALRRKYYLYEGFSSDDEIRKFLTQKKLDPECFVFISVEDQFYAISIETLSNEIVIAKKKSYIRQAGANFIAPNQLINWKRVYKFENPRINGYWDETYANELKKVYDVRVTHLGDFCEGYNFKKNSIILLSCFFNDTIK